MEVFGVVAKWLVSLVFVVLTSSIFIDESMPAAIPIPAVVATFVVTSFYSFNPMPFPQNQFTVSLCDSSSSDPPLSVVINQNRPTPAHTVSHIISGQPVPNGNFPWMVHLGGCGGSLVAPQYVVTAAHCGLSQV